MFRISSYSTIGLILTALLIPQAYATTRTAASCSTSAVQAAVDASVDGDTVLIPDGSCAWTSGISTSKQIWIRAANYVATPRGSASRSVTITNNSGSPLFQLTSGNSYHVRLSGIRFNEGSTSVNHVRISGSGAKVPLIDDCYFEVKNRFGNQPDVAAFAWLSLGGVMWNTRFQGVGGGLGGQCCPEGASILINSPRAWETASTLGTLDTNGTVNSYIEDSTLMNIGQSPDVDDRGRLVIRYSMLDGASGLTHGFTSSKGGRHFEYYNNTFTTTTSNRNGAGRYFWGRAGHGIFADNVVNSQNQGYGAPELFDSIVEGGGTYPKPRQIGWGHNGTTNVIDPIYIWNNTGSGGSSWRTTSPDFIQLNREIFVNSGPKPGYAKYTYPHPFRSGSSTPTPPTDTVNPSTPTSFSASVASPAQVNLSWAASADNVGVSYYKLDRCQGSSCSSFAQIATPSGTTYSDTGLSPNTTYSYRVCAYDSAGNVSGYSTVATITTPAAATDTSAPSVPSTFSATAASSSQVNLSWTTSTDNVGVNGYRVERCQGTSCSGFSQIATTVGTSYSNSGLTASTTYRFRVRASDAAGNLSGYSTIATVTTSATADTTAPSVPSNLSATAASSSQVSVSWTASTDSVGVTGYRIERCQGSSCSNFTQTGTPSGTTFSDTGLAASTAYRYRVRASDSAGNLSGYSNITNVTTLSTTTTALPAGNNGIAAMFPGDVNIRSNSSVLFADDFETYTATSQITNNWSQVLHPEFTRIATESANVFAGGRALEFRVPQQSAEVANALIKNVNPTEDTLFVRVYTKFDSGYNVIGSSHSGISVSSNYSTPGVPANGTNKFYVDVENSRDLTSETTPGLTNLYIYHPEQRSEWGDHWYPTGRVVPFDATPGDFGPSFVSRPDFTPALNKWYCYELMVKTNTPGQRDGRIAIWIDGVLVADFLNVRLRDVSSLKIDKFDIGFHIGSNTIRQNLKWYDNLVVARSYIGPMVTAGGIAPPTNLLTTVR